MGLTAYQIDDKSVRVNVSNPQAETEEARCRRTNGPRFAGSAGDGRSTGSPRWRGYLQLLLDVGSDRPR